MKKVVEYMERLTYRGSESMTEDGLIAPSYSDYPIRRIIERLAEYEDLEEQGLLLRLPCKVGDKLYYPNGYFNIVIPVRLNEIVMSFVGLDTYSFQYNCCSFDECGDAYEDYEFDLNDIGKTVFLTKAEAEQKLKEMESKKRI